MGNTSSDKTPVNHGLTAFHRRVLQIYETVLGSKKEIVPEDLEKLFPQRSEFCEKFTNWMKRLSYKHTANRESFIFACEVMLLDSELMLKEEYRRHSFNFIEIFLHMIVAKFPQQIEGVSQTDVMSFIRMFISLFLDDSKDNSMVINALGGLVHKQFVESDQIHPDKFLKLFKENLTTAVFFGKRQFEHLLLGEPIPKLMSIKEGHVLTDQMLLLIGLSNNKILNRETAQLIYSSKSMGNSFQRLAFSLTGYQAPIIILIKNTFDLIGSNNNISIFGAYAHCTWSDSLSYIGTPDTYLFTIVPEFKTFYPFNGRGGKDYLYLNTKNMPNSAYKSGMGIGGGIHSKARIWLDHDIMNKSYVEIDDSTFEKGVLSQSPYDYLKIDQIEIWGFPDEHTSDTQLKLKRQETEAILSSRKINIKEMFGHADDEFIIAENHKHEDGIEIEHGNEKLSLKRFETS